MSRLPGAAGRLPGGNGSSWSRRQLLSFLGRGSAAAGVLGAGAWGGWGELRLPELVGESPAWLDALDSSTSRQATAEALLLDSNENPFGMCSAARQRLLEAAEDANRYPGEYQAEIMRRLADYHGLPRSQIVTGSGSTDILRMAAAAWVRSSKGLVQARPTFEAMTFYAGAAGHETISIPVDVHGSHDLDAMRSAIGPDATLVYLCNPGNPTGALIPQADLDAFIESLPSQVIALVDEAYHHYVEDPHYRSAIAHVEAGRNVVVTRTFSKVYGMAGLRAGYAVGPENLIQELRTQRLQNNINVIAGACAVASLDDDAYPGRQRRLNSEARKVLSGAMDERGFDYWDSQTNFVMIKLGRDVREVNRAFRERGVYVGRLFPDVPQNLRVSIGTTEQMHRFVEEFDRVIDSTR